MTLGPRHPRAFTLVELLVVIGILALLIALLLPALNAARQQAVGVRCLANLRSMAQAAHAYAAENTGFMPPAIWDHDNDGVAEASWDYATQTDPATGAKKTVPGFLWGRRGGVAVMQCPSYDARRAGEDPFTGYNYNTSFIGGRRVAYASGGSVIVNPFYDYAPAKLSAIRDPVHTALFGDGGYSGGANKYMRAPLPSTADRDVDSFPGGTQAFRHRNKTNVAYVDGHAEAVAIRPDLRLPTTGQWPSKPGWKTLVGPGNGFLSQDNSAYDLR